MVKLSKADSRALEIMLQHKNAGNMKAFEKLTTSWFRSSTSNLVELRRSEALANL
jgi:hypothetical protein